MTADFNSSNFDMARFLKEQGDYTKKAYTAAEVAKQNMEAADIQRAKEAIEAEENAFLSLTLGEKLKELGIGKHVLNQIKETAVNAVADVIYNPIADYLEKYENIFNQDEYYAELQAIGKQHFFNNRELAKTAAESVIGTKFNYDM